MGLCIVLQSVVKRAGSDLNRVLRHLDMLQGGAVPAVDSGAVGKELVANLLPCHVMNVPVLQDHALVGIRNRLDDFPDLFLQVREQSQLVSYFILQFPQAFQRTDERCVGILGSLYTVFVILRLPDTLPAITRRFCTSIVSDLIFWSRR
jgi:hypothetical protein